MCALHIEKSGMSHGTCVADLYAFEAQDYTQEGIKSFQDFITDSVLHRMFLMGSYQLFVACENNRVVGMISLRNETHISLLFVEAACHRRGIGRALIRISQ